MIRRLRCLIAAATASIALLAAQPAGATTVQRVVSPGGIVAWLVHEPSLPLVALNFAFVGGATEDPADKPGVGYMVSSLLDDGEIQGHERERRLMNHPGDDAAGRNHPLHCSRTGRLRRECGDRHRRSGNEATQTPDHDRLSSRCASLMR